MSEPDLEQASQCCRREFHARCNRRLSSSTDTDDVAQETPAAIMARGEVS
jgi:DNA-directed RNA polymerase specialized sigma24 family protein